MRTLYNSLLAILCCLFIVTPQLYAGDFLPPDQAFPFSHEQETATLQLHWQIEEGYYLYEKRISAFYEQGDDIIDLPLAFTSQSKMKHDKNFGEVAVFMHEAHAEVDLSALPANQRDQVQIEYQGCSKNGLCYQPQLKTVALDKFTGVATTTAKQTGNTKPASNSQNLSDLTSTDSISAFLVDATLLSTVGIFLLLGIGLSLTPCILPMVPILSGIIVGHGESLTAKRGAMLSSSYVVGMAFTYAIAGMLAATFGAQGNLQMYMQNPWVISIFSLVFVALSLSMFGLYTLALPTRLQNALYNLSNKQQGGHFISVFVMGALSALVVSPCVSAPLAGALVFISSTGDMLIGGAALFALGIGMGLPLIAIGAGGGKLVPKAGGWMNQVKNFFGVILLGVAIWLLSRIIPGSLALLLWALLFIFYAVSTGALEPVDNGIARLKKAASFTLLFYGCILFVGALLGGSNPLEPIQLSQTTSSAQKSEEKNLAFAPINSLSELESALTAASTAGKPVMLDFYADWCTACLEMEHNVFNQQSVHQALNDYVLLQVDVTSNSTDTQQLLDRFGLFGPPSMIFFNAQKSEIAGKRIQGELSAEDFIQHIESEVNACTYQAC